MKTFLLFRDRDFDAQQPLPPLASELTQDLELNTLFEAMAAGDEYLFDVAQKAILLSLDDLDTIRYRQEILRDCLQNPDVVRAIYQLPIEAIFNKRKHWMGIFGHYPSGILSSALEMMQMFVELLRRLKKIADEHAAEFQSEGFTRLFSMVQNELDKAYFGRVEEHLRELRFPDGVLLSAVLGNGNEGAEYILRKPQRRKGIKNLFSKRSPVYSFSLHPRDDHGARALSDLKDRGVNQVANAVAQSTDHIDAFFNMLRLELAFYIGCLNLHEQLSGLGSPICFPQPVEHNERRLSSQGLYDVCLALTKKQQVVGNDIDADSKEIMIITGANQGGKSTLLRSIGLAQFMMQCGMFVPAEAFSANTFTGIFTHYKRKEDASMKSGKLDEELSRMSAIADHITPHSVVLFNESFAATNEREGSEIARQITRALLERQVKIFFVTHQYEFAHSYYEQGLDDAIFLRAERKTGGGRTYKLTEGEPLQTSYGRDLYNKIFEVSAESS